MLFFDLVLDVIFPKFCVGCGRFGSYICPACAKTIHFLPLPICPGCMGSIPECGIHTRCKKDTRLDGLLVLSSFEGMIKTIITEAKYQGYFDELHALTPALAVLVSHLPSAPSVIVPVPLFHDKLDERGFNQSWIIARDLAKSERIPTTDKLLLKTKKTGSQAGLSKKLRLTNVQDSFTCLHSFSHKESVLLIDDVVTTGSTLSACARALKKAGAGKVYGIALAHGH